MRRKAILPAVTRVGSWLLLAFSLSASAQRWMEVPVEPQLFRLDSRRMEVGVSVAGSHQENRAGGSATTTHDQIFVGPSLGLNIDGSIYHPNFLAYTLYTDGSLGWGQESYSGGIQKELNELQWLGRLDSTALLLENKPYRSLFTANYDHSYHEVDFFNQAEMDVWRYGVTSGYQAGLVPVTVSIQRQVGTSTTQYGSVSSASDSASLTARNERERGNTVFNYDFSRMDQNDETRFTEDNSHSFAILDTEEFGSRKQYNFSNNARYSRRNSVAEVSDNYGAASLLSVDHRRNLRSDYGLDYSHFAANDVTSDNYSGRAELTHQLYDSLSSRLFTQFSDSENSSGDGSGYTRNVGGGIAENYTKRIGRTSRLSVNNTFSVSHIMSQFTGNVVNEAHSFTNADSGPLPGYFFLNLPNVDLPIKVLNFDRSGLPWQEGADYIVLVIGSRAQIQRQFGSLMPDNVVVDYTAQGTSAGTYNSYGDTIQVRIDLWNNQWSLYALVNSSFNDAATNLYVQNLTSYVFGSDYRWKSFQAGVQYEIFESDQSPYRSARAYQSWNCAPDGDSTFGITFNQSWTRYGSLAEDVTDYRVMAHYRRVLTRHLRSNFDAGVNFRQGSGQNQTRGVFRTSFDYFIGRLTVSASYHFNYNEYANSELFLGHQFTLRMRRTF